MFWGHIHVRRSNIHHVSNLSKYLRVFLPLSLYVHPFLWPKTLDMVLI